MKFAQKSLIHRGWFAQFEAVHLTVTELNSRKNL